MHYSLQIWPNNGLDERQEDHLVINASNVVIWSADVDRDTLLKTLTNGSPHRYSPLRYVKVDRFGLTQMGLDIISVIQDLGFQVFADAKIIEIPDKVSGLTELHLAHRPWMLNVMAGATSTGDTDTPNLRERDALKRFADLCHAVGTRPCGVTVLTSKTDATVRREYNGRTPIEQVMVYAEMLLETGFTDMVCSANEAAAIRAESYFDTLRLNTPAIRLPGSRNDDQARVNTPAAAIAAGVDRLVIGRDLTNGDLRANFERIAAHLNP